LPSVVQDDVEQRAVNLQPAVVSTNPQLSDLFMKWLIRERVLPTISPASPG